MAGPYPDRPIKVIVPFSAGGGTDIIARSVSEKLSQKLGQSIVVINTPGAGGTIGASSVARAEPDGYTLLVWHIGMISSAHTNKPLPYDPLKSFTRSRSSPPPPTLSQSTLTCRSRTCAN